MEEMSEEKKLNLYEVQITTSPQNTTEENNNEILLEIDIVETSSQRSEMMKAPRSFYEACRPFIIAFNIFGMLPYSVNEKGDVKFKFSSKAMLYSIIFYILISPLVYWCLFLTIEMMKDEDNYFDIMVTVIIYFLMITHTIIPFFYWMQMDCFVATCKAWKSFQVEFEAVTGCPVFFRCNDIYGILFQCELLYFLIVFPALFFNFERRHIIGVIFHFFIIFSFFLHNVLFIMQSSNIFCITKDLQMMFKKVIVLEQYDAIPKWTQLWFSSSKLVHYLGKLFYKTYMYFIVMLFCVSTHAAYRIIRCVSLEGMSLSLLNSLVCFHHGILGLFVFCEFGEKVTLEVGTKFKQELIKLKFSVRNSSAKRNLQEFIDVISQNPPIVHLNGYVKLNRKLLINLLTLGAMCLFVTFQFSSPLHESSSISKNSSHVFSNNSSHLSSNHSFQFFSNDSSQPFSNISS